MFGIVSFFLLPRSPTKARFLTEKERTHIVTTLKRVGSVSEDEYKDNFSWTEVINSVKSPHVWFLVVVNFFSGKYACQSSFPLIDNDIFRHDTVWSCLVSTISVIFHGADTHSFQPTIVAELGYSGNQAQLMSVPPIAAAFVCAYFYFANYQIFIVSHKVALISGFISDHYQCRGYTVIVLSFLQLAGFIMFYGN